MTGKAGIGRWPTRLARGVSRESSTGHFIPEIDGLRFLSILAVVLYHLNGFVVAKTLQDGHADFLSTLLDKGYFGVSLFFAISGFVIAYPFARSVNEGRPAVSLRSYYLRRLSRIAPPYLINLTLIYLLLVAVKGVDAARLLPHFLASAGFLHNPVFGAHSLVNGVAWALEVECQFYVAAPLLVLLFRIGDVRRRRWIMVAVIAATSFTAFRFLPGNPRLELSLLNFLHCFLTGFLLADIFIVSWRESPQTGAAWDLLSVFCWVSVVWLLHRSPGWQVLLPLPVFGAFAGAFRGVLFRRFFRLRFVYLTGGMCYSIYLYHFFVISLIGTPLLRLPLGHAWPLWTDLLVMAVLVLPPVLVVCAVFYMATEKPFMKKDWPHALRMRVAGAFGG